MPRMTSQRRGSCSRRQAAWLAGIRAIFAATAISLPVTASPPAMAAGQLPRSGQLPQFVAVTPATSSNWSGYVMGGGPYMSVTGTFTVPRAQGYAKGATVSEWVGIDGWANGSLIQAGVNEIPDGPGMAAIEPWWQVMPLPQQLATGVMARPGDTVTVSIRKLATDHWVLRLADDTNGDVFATSYRYGGPATSAEWVVEANSQLDGSITALARYSPAVDFTGLGAEGQPGAQPATLQRVVMVQGGSYVSTPSPLSAAGFRVAYGPAAPSAL